MKFKSKFMNEDDKIEEEDESLFESSEFETEQDEPDEIFEYEDYWQETIQTT